MNLTDRFILGTILAEFEGCPEIVAVDALRNAFIEFCRESYGWQGSVNVMSDASALPSSNDMNVIDIVDARIADKRIAVTFMNADEGEYDCADYVIRFADPNHFELEPAPTTPVEIKLTIIAAPLPSATLVPDHIWHEWHEALRHGAIGRIHESAKPWADAQKAGAHLGKFSRAVGDASIRYARNRRNHGRRLRVRPV